MQEPIYAQYSVNRVRGVVTVFWEFTEQKRSFFLVYDEKGTQARQSASVIVNHNLHGVADNQRDINRVLFTLIHNAKRDLGQDDFFETSEMWYDAIEEHSPESIFARFVIKTAQ